MKSVAYNRVFFIENGSGFHISFEKYESASGLSLAPNGTVYLYLELSSTKLNIIRGLAQESIDFHFSFVVDNFSVFSA